MGWSKSTRISVMLGIDIAFFIVELGVGIYVGSLALLADAFHMLNDIISLIVGLWAVIVARKATSDKYTYGWLRAEILGAFFNAVFLIALCVSIILEAITRFIDPPVIKNPKLILIVGSLGLLSNCVGFFVLGGHGHSHGNHEHDQEHLHGTHGHNILGHAEEGYGSLHQAVDDSSPAVDILPEVAVARATNQTKAQRTRSSQSEMSSDTVAADHSDARITRSYHRSGVNKHARLQSIDDMAIHPASFRQEIIAASRSHNESPSESGADDSVISNEAEEPTEDSSLLTKHAQNVPLHLSRRRSSRSHGDLSLHDSHHHKKPKKSNRTGHNHGDMGMNAMILHVIGDALGNVGVIATALIIWLTAWEGRYYADPAVSLFITIIILRSCLPLTFATSKILLQATPDHLDVSEIREDIESLPGVVSCHHIHIWQLSDTQLVVSMHIHVEFPISEAGGDKYMQLARRVRNCLHEYGIHSATIQPEFCTDDHHFLYGSRPGEEPTLLGETMAHSQQTSQLSQQAKSCAPGDGLCLLECVDDCIMQGCCKSATLTEGSVHSDHSGHDQSHDENH